VGIFAQRGKNRPNQLGVTVVKVIKREDTRLTVQGLDAVDGTHVLDIKKGFFGTSTLQAIDFETATSKTYGPFTSTPASNWYSINLTSGKAYINKLASSGGVTQIHLRFKLDDNNNAIANYLSLFSGNAPAASRPQLIIEYYVP
jgi:hypothetical protein